MLLKRTRYAAVLCSLAIASPIATAEELGSLITGGANQVTSWCSDGTNTYSVGCSDSLSQLLLGPRPAYPPPTPSSSGGNVELGFPPSTLDWDTPTTLSGTFQAGDGLTVSSLTRTDWTQSFCQQWITDITSGNGVVLNPVQVSDICSSLLTTETLLKQASNPNISYVSRYGAVRIGTATIYNASPVLKLIAGAAGIDPNAVPDFVQFSEPVKVTYQGETSIYYCAESGSITQTDQWADDSACPFNQNPELAKQFCSHSGNCEIVLEPPDVVEPVPAISSLGLAGSAAGLLAFGLAGLGWRRRND